MKTHSQNFRLLTGVVSMLLIFSFMSLYAQNEEAVTTVRGKILDQRTGKPLIFASIFVVNSGVATVSNSEGDFILKVPQSLQSNPVKFSFMGYRPALYKLSDLKTDNNVISLDLETINIKDVIVRANDPVALIKRALENIPGNYGSSPSLCTAFYRESILQNRQYAGVAEAVLTIYKSGYSPQKDNDRIKVFKGRKSQDIKKMDTLIFKLQGGHYVALLLDLAKNPETFMDEQYFNNYIYQPVTLTSIEGRETYVIEFAQKREIEDAFYEGRLYIDMNTLAIKKAEFSISPTGLPFADRYLVKRKPADTKVKTVNALYSVDFRDINGRWTLNHVRYEVKFKVDKKGHWFSKTYTSTVDLAVTDKDTVNVTKFKLSESLKPNQIFIDHVSEYYDEDFWGSYNIIKPEEPIEEAIKRISKRMKKYQPSANL
jgi:hypothetical protein